jgi:hypothetical protein
MEEIDPTQSTTTPPATPNISDPGSVTSGTTSVETTPPNSPPPDAPKSGVNKKLLMIVGAVVLLLLLAGGGYYFWMNKQTASTTSPTSSEESTTQTSSPEQIKSDEMGDWRTITSTLWSIKVPANWNYLECNSRLIFADPYIEKDNTDGECILDSSPGIFQAYIPDDERNFVIREDNDPNDNYSVSEVEELKVGGYDAIIRREIETGVPGADDKYYVYIPSKLAILTLHKADQKETFDQILSTFEFVD